MVLLISVVTGFVFTIIVTRQLTQDEFGLWSLIGSLLLYVMIFDSISTYWVTRHVARNERASVTALSTNGMFSVLATVIYIVMIFFISNSTKTDYNILLLSSILIPLSYLNNSMRGIILGFRTQGIGYGTLIFEFTKIPAGLFLVYLLHLGLAGAIISTAIAQVVQLIFYSYYIKDKLKEKLHIPYIKKWLRLSWLPTMRYSPLWIVSLDATVFAVFVGSVTSLAIFGAAKTISNVIGYSKSISSALYPKLLSERKGEYIELMIKRTLFFTIPLTGMSIIFAKPSLWILNPIYVSGILVVYVWIIIQFVYVFQDIFQDSLLGLERIDINPDSRFKDYIKSRLFSVPVLFAIVNGSYVISFVIVLIISPIVGISQLGILFWGGIAGIITHTPQAAILWKWTAKSVSFRFPYKNISKYSVTTIISVILTYVFMLQYLSYEKSIFTFIPHLIPFLLLFCASYFSIIYVLDRETRLFFGTILKEFSK